MVRDKDKLYTEKTALDKLLLNTPLAALQASHIELIRGVELLREMVIDMMVIAYTDDMNRMENISSREKSINIMQKDLTRYVSPYGKNWRPVYKTSMITKDELFGMKRVI